MRRVINGPLQRHSGSRALCRSLWTCWTASRQHLPAPSRPTRQRPPFRTAPPSSPLEPSGARASGMSSAAAAQAACSAPAGGSAPSDDASCHLLAVCRTAEDAARVTAVANEIAAAGSPPSLVFHLDDAAVPPYAAAALDAAACGRQLAARGTRVMGRVVLAAATLGSTQELLRSHGSALGDGVVVVADRQTSGKGRGGNQWTSPLGCLMFSALRRLRVTSPAQAPFINYLVCLAVTRGVRRALQETGHPPLDIRIKWPNDIYVDGVKIAGALIHTTWQGSCFNVITGIGINVNNRTPTTCLDELLERAAAARAAADADAAAAAAVTPSGPPSVSREAVLTGILAAMEEVYDAFEQHGFASLESEYLATWLHSRQVLDFDDTNPNVEAAGGGTGRVTRLTVLGLSTAGFLMAEDESGSQYELTPDGNSLDMMKGLIRRKML